MTERSTKDIIKDMREIVKPFISDCLKRVNYEGKGDTDKVEFEKEFEKVLTLAEKAEPLSEVLDKISAEIKDTCTWDDKTLTPTIEAEKVLEIIEKYKGVSE